MRSISKNTKNKYNPLKNA